MNRNLIDKLLEYRLYGILESNNKVYVINDNIYLLEGLKNITYSGLQVYDNENKIWLKKPHFENSRYHYSTVLLDNKIYIIGGWDGIKYYNDLQCFDITDNKWVYKKSFDQPRCMHTSNVVNGKIYMIGGYNTKPNNTLPKAYNNPLKSTIKTLLSDVKIYDPKTDTWTDGKPLDHGRSNHHALVMNNKIYILGGYSDKKEDRYLKIYDTLTNIWLPIKTHNIYNNEHFIPIIVNDKLYIIDTIDNSKVYDENNDKWVDVNI